MNWYIKKFSVLTKVSVATLHHYDAIGLLKPSVRSSNGYRLYSEKDLLKLERIVALKFFGFSLQKIKILIGNDEEILEHLQHQIKFLEKQINQLHQAQQLAHIIAEKIDMHTSIDWALVVSLIKAYQMTKELRKSWATKIYTDKELKQLAEIDQQYPEAEKIALRKSWAELCIQVEAHLHENPTGPIGKKLGLQYKSLKEQLHQAYKNYPQLWEKIWNMYKQGKIPNEALLGTQEQLDWLEQAAHNLK